MERRLQEADAVDHDDLAGDHEQTVLGGGAPRAGGESFRPRAARHHRPLARGGATVEKPNLARKEEGAREEAQHQGAQGDFARPWATTKKARPAGVVGDSSSGTTSGGATVWTPACDACTVCGICSQEKWSSGTLLCGARSCTAGRARREALYDSGTRRVPDYGEDWRLRGLCHPLTQDTPGTAGPFDDVPL